MAKKHIAIFDLDNTLIDVDQRFWMLLKKNLLFVQQQTGKDNREKAEKLLQHSPWLSMEEICRRILSPRHPQYDYLVRQCVQHYYEGALGNNIKILPGTYAVLRFLKQHNIALYLVTYGDPLVQQGKIQQIGEQWFDGVYITQDKKENIFRSLVQSSRVQQENCFVIGDKKQDEIAAGNHLGVSTIHFCYGRHAQQKSIEKPLYTVYNMRELLHLFKTLLCSKISGR